MSYPRTAYRDPRARRIRKRLIPFEAGQIAYGTEVAASDPWTNYWCSEDPLFDNIPGIRTALMDGNVKLRLKTTRSDKVIGAGQSLRLTSATAPQLDLDTNIVKWFRAADETSTDEWDPTGGEGSTPASLRDHMSFTDCTSVVLKNGTIQGLNTLGHPNTVLEKEAAVTLRSCSGAEIEDIYAKYVWGDGLMLRATNKYLPRISEDILITNHTVETVGRMQAAFTNFQHLTVNGFTTSPLTVSLQGAGITNRSAFDIEMVQRADASPPLNESGHADIYNWSVAANFFAMANAGGGYVHDVHFHHGTLRQMGTHIITSRGRVDDAFAKREDFEVDNIVWPEVGGANNAMNFEYIRGYLRIHDNDVHESNLGAGKNGIGLTDCDSVEVEDNMFSGGFSTLYDDDGGLSTITSCSNNTPACP